MVTVRRVAVVVDASDTHCLAVDRVPRFFTAANTLYRPGYFADPVFSASLKPIVIDVNPFFDRLTPAIPVACGDVGVRTLMVVEPMAVV